MKRKYKKYKKNGLTLKKLDYKIKKMARNQESKIFDTIRNDQTTQADGIFWTINNMAQGIEVTERIGDKASISYVKLDFVCKIQSTDPASLVRIIVFLDKQNEITTVTDILEFSNPITVIGGIQSYQSEYYRDTRKNYKIIKDIKLQMNPTDKLMVSKKVKFRCNINTLFQNASTTIQTNSIKVLALSTADTVSGAVPPQLYMYSRVFFKDD